MKSRLAMVLMVALGLMVSGTGAGLAVQGSSGNGNAAQNQYPKEKPPGGVLGEEDSGDAGQPAAQQERQVAAGVQGGGSELPFTGFAAIPIIVLGVAMIATGMVLRRRTGRSEI